MSEPDSLAKRRRLNSSVHKPFVSPLKSRPGNTPQRPSSSDGLFKKPASPLSTSVSTPSKTSHTLSTLRTPSDLSRSPFVTASSTASLLLSKQLTALRSTIDTLRQAQQILTRAKAIELTTLRDKWRGATRLAAEELFAIMQDKMNRMGGVAAWREGEMRKRARMEEWRREDERAAERAIEREGDVESSEEEDEEEEDVQDGEEDEEDGVRKTQEEKRREKQERREQRAAMRAVREEAKEARKEAMENAKFERENDGYDAEEREAARQADREKGLIGNDDDAYTMSMMLSQLNVELDVIRYDKDQERWLDD